MAIEATVPLEANFEVKLPPAPYPGLRPFEKHEWPVFFGREEMADGVIRRLIRQHLVVVHGDSGCGKSSLIRAGVLAQLEQEHARSGVRWRTCAMRPREAPLRNLVEVLAQLDAAETDRTRIRQIRRCLNMGQSAPAALAELLRRGDDDHVCILIDQFEELFSFARKHGRDEAQLFVDILVGLQADPPPGLYAILTMRSEFLGACARFKGLAEAVNRTQYLLPQMERPALMRAIHEPATLYDGEVTQELAERLIADTGGEQDQLPLIQHGLMRLWRLKAGPPTGLAEATEPWRRENVLEDAAQAFRHKGSSEEPVPRPIHESDDALAPKYRSESGPAWRLGLEDYQGAGGLADLLSAHADEVMAAAAPDDERQNIIEHLFRALIDINAEGSAVRRPQTLAELAAVTGSDQRVLRDIVDCFRADGVSFLRPYHDQKKAIEPGTLIDISHEALIRCWRKVKDEKDGWLQQEFQDGLIWKTLRMQAQRGEILSAMATEARDAWLDTLPSPAWTERYDDAWHDVQRLMIASRNARDEELQRKRDLEEAERREAEERARRAEEAHQAAVAIAAKQQELREAQERIAEEQRQRAESEQQRAKEAEAHAREADASRRRFKRVAVGAAASALVALGAALAASWSWWQATRAEAEAQLGDSLFRSVQARDQLKEGWPITAMQLALAGLSDGPERPGARPWVGEAAGALVEAMGAQRELKAFRGDEGFVWSVAFSPQGDRIVSGGEDGAVRLWHLDGRPAAQPFRGHEGLVRSVAYSPQGDRIVSGGEDGKVRLWHLDGRPAAQPFTGHQGDVWSVAFSPRGDRIVSGGEDGVVRLWQLDGSSVAPPFKDHEGELRSVAFSPQGDRFVSGGEDGKVRVWFLDGSLAAKPFEAHAGSVRSVAFSSHGDRIVSGGQDGTVRLWHLDGRPAAQPFTGHNGEVRSVAFSPQGDRIVSGGQDGTVRLWHLDGSPAAEPFKGHQGWVWSVAFSPDGERVVSGSADGTVRVWNAASGEGLLVLGDHENWVRTAAFSPDGERIVIGSTDNAVRVWDLTTGKVQVLKGHKGWVNAVAYSPDRDRIVSASADQTVRLWMPERTEDLPPLHSHGGAVYDAAFSPEGGRIVSGYQDKRVRVWNAITRRALLELTGHEGPVNAVAYSRDGARVASGSADDTVRVWDVAKREELLVLRGHSSDVLTVAFSPDGRRIVSGAGDGTLRTWDSESGANLLRLSGFGWGVLGAAFSPDGTRIVSGCADGTVRVWGATSGEALLVLRSHAGPVWAAEFSPDGAGIVSAGEDKTVRVIWVPRTKQELVATARARLPRELTDEERRRFHLAVE